MVNKWCTGYSFDEKKDKTSGSVPYDDRLLHFYHRLNNTECLLKSVLNYELSEDVWLHHVTYIVR